VQHRRELCHLGGSAAVAAFQHTGHVLYLTDTRMIETIALHETNGGAPVEKM